MTTTLENSKTETIIKLFSPVIARHLFMVEILWISVWLSVLIQLQRKQRINAQPVSFAMPQAFYLSLAFISYFAPSTENGRKQLSASTFTLASNFPFDHLSFMFSDTVLRVHSYLYLTKQTSFDLHLYSRSLKRTPP